MLKRKIVGLGLVIGLMAVGAMAQEVSNEVKVESAAAVAPAADVASKPDSAGLPEGVTTEKNPLKQAFLAKAKSQPALFRPSPNMPEVVNEDLLRGMSESGKAAGKSSQFIGYMPKLVVLPCAKGCEGRDYERAVKEFIKGYRGDGKYFQERGEMIVQVRWYNTRPFLQRQLPYGSDLFGVSFMLEGKVVSLGKKSGVGKSISSYELASDIGARLAMELAYTMGMGVKPTFLLPGIGRDDGLAGKVMGAGAAVDGMLGVEDIRSRIEPATEANANLMPAIDGIKPGEIAPIAQMYYLNSLLF